MADENMTAAAGSTPSPQEDKDRAEFRRSMVEKATARIKEIGGYLGRINDVVGSVLPELAAKHTFGEAVDLFVLLENETLEAAAQIQELAGHLAKAREVSFPARMDADEVPSSKTSTGHRIVRSTKIFASMKSDVSIPDGGVVTLEWLRERELDELPELVGEYKDLVGNPLGFAWLMRHEYESLIKPTVNASSLSAAAKAIIESGFELPDTLFKTFTKDNVSITRAPGTKPAAKSKKKGNGGSS